MATRQTSVKIPKNVRKSRAALDTIVPSVKGIALRAATLKAGITVLQTARAVAAKTGDTELAALVNSPKLNKALDAAIKRLSRQADSILRATLATKNDNPEAQVQSIGSGSVNTPHNCNDPSAVSGQDAAVRQIQNARFSVAMDVAAALGMVNPARVAAGLGDEVPDDVYEHMKSLSK